MQQGNNLNDEDQAQFIAALEELQKRNDFLLYLLEAINNEDLAMIDRFNASNLMRHSLRSCKFPETNKILKSKIASVLIPLLSNSNTDPYSSKFTNSIAALIAEAAEFYGVGIFSEDQSIDQIILNLLTPSNPPNLVLTALNLVQDLLYAKFTLNPDIILCFPSLIEEDIDITFKILEVCDLFAKRGCSEAVKKVILAPLLENYQSLPKEAFIQLINVSSTALLKTQISEDDENEGESISPDSFNSQLIQFILACMGDPDESKSSAAMTNFIELQEKLGFIPESVILIYNNLTLDDGLEADENQNVKSCMSTLESIADNHSEECLELIIPQIKQDLNENDPEDSTNSMKRGLRGLAAISQCLPDSDIEEICVSIVELLNTPMRKEAIFTLEKIACAHKSFYTQSLGSIFPYICFNEEGEGNSSLRMRAQRSLFNLMSTFSDEIKIPCDKFINFVYQMLQISYKTKMDDELNFSLIFIDSFFKAVESLIVDEKETETSSIIKNILEFAVQAFLSEKEIENDSLYFYSFNVISSAISKTASFFLSISNESSSSLSFFPISFSIEIISRVHPKCLYLLSNSFNDELPEEKKPDDEFSSEMISMYSSLYSFLNCKNEGILNYKDPILEIIHPILPILSEFLPSKSTYLSNISWGFASMILRSPLPQLFQEFLLKSAVDTISSYVGLDDEMISNFLGNMALVFYDVFKMGILNLENFSKDDFEEFINVFSTPIKKEMTIDSEDLIDFQNISLLILKLGELTNLPISDKCLIHAAEIIQTIEESFPEKYAEAQEMMSTISQNHKPEEEEEDDGE